MSARGEAARWISRVGRRLNAQRAVRAAVVPFWVAAAAAGALRFVWPERAMFTTAGVLLAALAFTLVLAWRARATPQETAARADLLAGAGGLLLTATALPLGEWNGPLAQKLRRATLPPLQLGRPAGTLLAAMLFLALCHVVPLPAKDAPRVNVAAATALADVQAKAEVVREEEGKDPAVEEALAALRKELAESHFDGAGWEATDALEAKLRASAREAAAELGAAQAAAKALEDAVARGADEEAQARAQDALERALMDLSDGRASNAKQAWDQAEAGNQGSNGSRSGESGEPGEQAKQQQGKQGGKPGRPSQQRLKELRKALTSRRGKLGRAFGEGREVALGENGKGKPDGVLLTEGDGSGDGDGMEGDGSGTPMASRGGGSVPLTFGDEAEVHPERLKFAPLPDREGTEPGALRGLVGMEPSKVLGAQGAAKGTAAEGERAPSRAREALLPRNQALVKRYSETK